MACLRPAKGADLSAVAQSVATAIELGACPAVIAVDGYASVDLEHLVTTLNRNVPDARVAFNRVAFSLANNAVALAVLETCKRLDVGVVACDPLGNGACVTDATHPEHDVGQVQLLSFLGAMVGGGVQRSPTQVGLNWVISKGCVPEIETRMPTRGWECGGGMLWRLDENAVGIVDERCAATGGGEGGGEALA